MAPLKQILITMAVTAGVLATPLSVDTTATAVAGAPEPVATRLGKPLTGKALKEYLANRPDVPVATADVTRIMTDAEYAQYLDAHPDKGVTLASSSALMRSGPCDQGDCPDYTAPFDLLMQRIVQPVWGSNPPTYVDMWYYYGRWNDCNQCGKVFTNKDGCFNFTSCGRPQSICIDIHKFRAHRLWRDVGHTTCYKMRREYMGGCGAASAANEIDHPVEEVPCNW